MVDTTPAYDLLINGSLFPAVHAYYTLTFFGWFYGMLWFLVIGLLLLKTKDPLICFTIGSIAWIVMWRLDLVIINNPVAYFIYIVLIGLAVSIAYTWVAK